MRQIKAAYQIFRVEMDSPLAKNFVTDSIVSQWSNRMAKQILSFVRGSANGSFVYIRAKTSTHDTRIVPKHSVKVF